LAEREEYLRTIVNSDDPVAHEVLVRTAVDSSAPEVRELSEKAIIERARRLGLMRSAEEVRQWLPSSKNGSSLSPAYEPLLKALNTSIPLEARGSLLRRAYAAAPKIALRVAGALALDIDDLEGFHPILAPLVGDDLHLDDTEEHSSAALILASPDLSGRYGSDIIRKAETLRDGDVLWALQMLAGRNDINVRAVASIAIERSIVTGVRQSYLSIVRDRGDLPPDVLGALVRASTGKVTADDVSAFGRWYDLISEKVLLSLCADLDDRDLALAAFDMLAGRSLTSHPAAEIVEWVRGEAWDNRANFVRVVGILGNLDLTSPEAVTDALGAFDPHVKDTQIMGTLLSAENPLVVRAVLKRYVKMLSLGRLLILLDSPDAEVRTLAIRGMSAVNDAGVLKLIIDHYEKEKDPGVQAVYKETFWVIRQREEGKK
jgi:hypothetical protein